MTPKALCTSDRLCLPVLNCQSATRVAILVRSPGTVPGALKGGSPPPPSFSAASLVALGNGGVCCLPHVFFAYA